MSVPRIYQNIALAPNATITLGTEATVHLVQVLRLKLGATFNIFDGQGNEYTAALTHISKKQALAIIGTALTKTLESPLLIHLGQGISRGERMDYTLQKAVELGVNVITPLFTEHCEVKLPPERLANKLAHWQKIIIAAAEQCGRNHLPILAPPLTLAQWLASSLPGLSLILHPYSDHPINLARLNAAPQQVNLLVGPEGGFSSAEVTAALQQQFALLQLGPRILRTETAAPAAIAILQHRWGDL